MKKTNKNQPVMEDVYSEINTLDNAKDFKNLDRKGYLEGDIPTVGMFVSGFIVGFTVCLILMHVLLIQVL